jgi:hypothetical protein
MIRAGRWGTWRWRSLGGDCLADLALVRARTHLFGSVASEQALEIVSPPGGPVLPVAGIAYVGLAEVAYQRGELEAALRHLTEGLVACRQLIHAQPLATGLATLAWIRQAKGDTAGALETMAEAERVAPSPSVTGLLNPVPAQHARLLLAQGTTPRPPAGHKNAAWASTMSQAIPRARASPTGSRAAQAGPPPGCPCAARAVAHRRGHPGPNWQRDRAAHLAGVRVGR